MIWDRWRKALRPSGGEPPPGPFEDLVEEAPVVALLLDRDQRVLAANDAARRYFNIESARLPQSLVEATLEGNLVDVLRGGRPESEVHLVHRRREARTKLVPGPRPGDTLLFLIDVTELRHLERVRQEFVANLVHELKTPITSLRLTAESLLHDPPAVERTRFAARIVREADLMSRIIDNLRQLAELEAGQPAIEVSRFDVVDLIQELAPRAGPTHEVRVEGPTALEITTDRTKLAQALANLFENAGKFSSDATPIDVILDATDEGVRITVRDHGPGISPEHWSRVFERFYKIDPARPRQAGGFGLGLAITKHLVQSLGGKVSTRNAEGGGQTFTIELPLP